MPKRAISGKGHITLKSMAEADIFSRHFQRIGPELDHINRYSPVTGFESRFSAPAKQLVVALTAHRARQKRINEIASEIGKLERKWVKGKGTDTEIEKLMAEKTAIEANAQNTLANSEELINKAADYYRDAAGSLIDFHIAQSEEINSLIDDFHLRLEGYDKSSIGRKAGGKILVAKLKQSARVYQQNMESWMERLESAVGAGEALDGISIDILSNHKEVRDNVEHYNSVLEKEGVTLPQKVEVALPVKKPAVAPKEVAVPAKKPAAIPPEEENIFERITRTPQEVIDARKVRTFKEVMDDALAKAGDGKAKQPEDKRSFEENLAAVRAEGAVAQPEDKRSFEEKLEAVKAGKLMPGVAPGTVAKKRPQLETIEEMFKKFGLDEVEGEVGEIETEDDLKRHIEGVGLEELMEEAIGKPALGDVEKQAADMETADRIMRALHEKAIVNKGQVDAIAYSPHDKKADMLTAVLNANEAKISKEMGESALADLQRQAVGFAKLIFEQKAQSSE